jgi:hypothetical protein
MGAIRCDVVDGLGPVSRISEEQKPQLHRCKNLKVVVVIACCMCVRGEGSAITADIVTACLTNKTNRFPFDVSTLYGFWPVNCM